MTASCQGMVVYLFWSPGRVHVQGQKAVGRCPEPCVIAGERDGTGGSGGRGEATAPCPERAQRRRSGGGTETNAHQGVARQGLRKPPSVAAARVLRGASLGGLRPCLLLRGSALADRGVDAWLMARFFRLSPDGRGRGTTPVPPRLSSCRPRRGLASTIALSSAARLVQTEAWDHGLLRLADRDVSLRLASP